MPLHSAPSYFRNSSIAGSSMTLCQCNYASKELSRVGLIPVPNKPHGFCGRYKAPCLLGLTGGGHEEVLQLAIDAGVSVRGGESEQCGSGAHRLLHAVGGSWRRERSPRGVVVVLVCHLQQGARKHMHFIIIIIIIIRLRERGRMFKSVYVRVVHDSELLCSSLCDRPTALISRWDE